MEQAGLHSGLELRLNALGMRITRLNRDMLQARGIEKIVDVGELEGLEQHYKTLRGQLRALNLEGPRFRQNAKAEIEQMADDLTGTLENFVKRLDSQNVLDKRR